MVSLTNEQKIFHLANRTTFGINQETLGQINQLGINEYLRSQLYPQCLCLVEKENFRYLDLTPGQVFERHYKDKEKRKNKSLSSEEKKQLNRQRRNFLNDTRAFKYINSINNPNQLQDVMTNFWFNHFNVFVRKHSILQMFLIYNYEQKTIRPLALGKFKDLLTATVYHPSMLYYLDNWKNIKPQSNKKKKRRKGLNENYARELMELHTLGVNGGYTQSDVISLAKILTGLTVINPNTPQNEKGFFFNPKLHDYSDKKFLGQTIKGEGIKEIDRVINILANHPSTANHVSFKLAQYFVADNPPSGLVNKLAQTFTKTQGDIAQVLNQLFQSEEFYDNQYYRQKFKTPYEYVMSVLRLGDISQLKERMISRMLRKLNMLPYNRLTPDGYENTKSAWLSPTSMIDRLDFAMDIAEQNKNYGDIVKVVEDYLSSNTLKAVKQGNLSAFSQTAMILGSPEMMYR